MDKIYLKNNYVICEISSEKYEFSIYYTRYHETSSAITLNDWFGMSLTIPVASITSIYDEAGVMAYTTATLLSFLRQNTGFKSPPGGSGGISDGDKGDITVSGLGSTWTIDNLAVTNAKINDVDGSKVTQSASYRLVTDTEKSTWNGKLTPNAPITGATKTKITYDANGLVTAGADASTADIADSTNKRYVTDADIVKLSNTSGTNTGDETTATIQTKLGTASASTSGYLTSTDWNTFNNKQPAGTYATGTGTANGTNTGDQTSIVGISGTKANFDTACTDGNFLFVGDVIGLTDGDKGDITVSSSGTVWNIDASTIGLTELSATGTPSATTFLRGDNTWATPTATDPSGWTTIVKSANQDVTGSTYTDDTELQFSVVAGGNYMLELHISTSGDSSTNDYKFQFAVSTGTMIGGGNAIHRNATNVAANTALTAPGVAVTPSVIIGQNGGTIPTSSGVISAVANYAFRASANATFKFQFACNAGTTSVARTWKGSILKYKRID